MSFNVAIDGPAGAGRSTVAKSVAALKNFIYVDTGAMYRAMALYFLRQGIDKTDENAINAVLDKVEITIRYENGAQQVILNGENVSGLIRTEEVGNMASATSVYKKVREKLVELQKDLAKKADVIMILINDEKQAAMYKESIAPNLRPGMMLMFAHVCYPFWPDRSSKGCRCDHDAPRLPDIR